MWVLACSVVSLVLLLLLLLLPGQLLLLCCGLQIEGILWDTCTGSDERLHRYYAYWVAKIFRALTNMVLSNLRRFITILSGDRPLCKMFALVAYPEVVLSPSPIEVTNSLNLCLRVKIK